MKLETKLSACTGTFLFAMFVSAFVAQMKIQEANRLSAIITEQRLPAISRARDVRYHMLASVTALESYVLFATDPASSAHFREVRKASLAVANQPFAELLNQASHFDLNTEGDQLSGMRQDLVQFEATEEEVEGLQALHTPEGSAHAYALLRDRILPINSRLFVSLRKFVQSQERQSDSDTALLHEANRSVLITLWTATILGALVGGFISFFLARRIARGIGLVAERAQLVALGDLSNHALNIHSSDQIGSLAHAMEQMQDSLAGIIRTVATSTRSLTDSSTSMSVATDHMHRRVNEQAQQTEQAATSMQEMSASIAEVSRHTRSAAETARSAAQTAREGGAIVQQMLGSMHSIATAVRDTSATVGLLGEDSLRISQIVTVIDEIATKTNLLALNAAIEAARAGEHGRGFAVVAAEVRRLAESTAQATGEISAMIQGIQQRTHTAVASMASGILTVEQGVATTNRAGEALERIIGIAEHVDRMIAQIAIAASQQAAAAGQSSSSLDAIHSLSFDNLSEMATTTLGIESLRATAAALESQVKRFRLDQPPTDFNPSLSPLDPLAPPHPDFA